MNMIEPGNRRAVIRPGDGSGVVEGALEAAEAGSIEDMVCAFKHFGLMAAPGFSFIIADCTSLPL